MTSSDIPVEPRALEELEEIHQVGDDWEPRFVADLEIAEQKADEYDQLGYDVEIYPHPDDVSRGQMPDEHDRCVVYTRPREAGGEGGGIVDDDLL